MSTYPKLQDYQWEAKNVVSNLFEQFEIYTDELIQKKDIEIEELQEKIKALESEIEDIKN